MSGSPDYNGDAVEMYIDARNTKQARYDGSDFRYTLGYGHTTVSEPAHSGTAGVRFVRRDYPGGYRTQVSIPWTTLGVRPFPGMSIGLDAAIDDASTAAQGRTAALFWHDADANDWQNPSLFGNGTLQPRSRPAPLPDGAYRVVNVNSGKVLDVRGASMANVALDQSVWNGGSNQQWIFKNLGGGSYSIQNAKSGSVVDCSPTFDIGHPVVQWPIDGTPSATQRFTLTPIGGAYLLTNVYSGRALDVKDAAKDDHAAVIQSACTASSSQLWDLVPLSEAAP